MHVVEEGVPNKSIHPSVLCFHHLLEFPVQLR